MERDSTPSVVEVDEIKEEIIEDGEAASSSAADDVCLALVHNIPADWRSTHLRHFFSDFVDTGKFLCFHFRHRPELLSSRDPQEPAEKQQQSKTCCCLIKMTQRDRLEFFARYNGRRWTFDGKELPRRCFISKVKIAEDGEDGKLSAEDLETMPELRPPQLMPQGNVGTPTAFFMEQIQRCSLPPSVIKKLGLSFSKAKRRIYSSVNFEYERSKSPETAILERMNPPDTDEQTESPTEDKDACEEWERHEAFYDDVTSQDRIKPKLFEEEMEVIWEKGGSGLVFYTDDFFWDQQESTDTDERWADDWDVDMELYYDPTAGDKDSRDHAQIRREKELATGKLEESAFSKKLNRKRQIGQPSEGEEQEFGAFLDHSKGVARQILERQGWKRGDGLGAKKAGLPYPVALDVELEAQSPRGRKGLGYRGEKLQRFGLSRPKPRHLITTKYDDQRDTDPQTPTHRRSELTWNKFRKH